MRPTMRIQGEGPRKCHAIQTSAAVTALPYVPGILGRSPAPPSVTIQSFAGRVLTVCASNLGESWPSCGVLLAKEGGRALKVEKATHHSDGDGAPDAEIAEPAGVGLGVGLNAIVIIHVKEDHEDRQAHAEP